MNTIASQLAVIPSPPIKSLNLGPLTIEFYGIAIALACVAAIWLASKHWQAAGGHGDDVAAICFAAIPAGIVGARLYHVITDYQLYTDNPLAAFAIWNGGLGIWGGVAAGALTGFIVARRRGLDAVALLDIAGPAIALGQAVGRWGNYFNQELFGRATELPWALHVDPQFRPLDTLGQGTYHPLFLYESLWNLALCAALVLIARKFNVVKGNLFALYVAGYTFTRFFLERLRVDEAHLIFGLRVNEWTSLILFAAAVGVFVIRQRRSDSQQKAVSGAE